MFFFLSKFASFLFTPLGFFLLITGSLFFSQKKKKALLTIILGGFYVISNQWIVNELVTKWEEPIQDRMTLSPKKWGIVLTGGFFGMDTDLAINNLHLGPSADRIWQAYRLYKEDKIEKIVVSGGYVPFVSRNAGIESVLAKEFLVENGVDAADIILETKARNTHENALYSVKLAEEYGISPSDCYIISSSYHIKRSRACFQKYHFNASFFGTNPRQAERTWKWIYLIPSRYALEDFLNLYHEWLGYVSYWIAGYI